MAGAGDLDGIHIWNSDGSALSFEEAAGLCRIAVTVSFIK